MLRMCDFEDEEEEEVVVVVEEEEEAVEINDVSNVTEQKIYYFAQQVRSSQ